MDAEQLAGAQVPLQLPAQRRLGHAGHRGEGTTGRLYAKLVITAVFTMCSAWWGEA